MTVLAINKGEQFSSFDVAAFEVPGGRDELWRFTPLKRLRGLHEKARENLRPFRLPNVHLLFGDGMAFRSYSSLGMLRVG